MFQPVRPIYRPRRKWRRSVGATASYFRRLAIELLEDRRLLSITVNTLVDENNGIGIGGISLRDAIAAAAPGESISFAASLTSGGPASLLLTNGELIINKSLTIDGPGANLLTVDAQLASRVIDITAGAFTVDISGLRLTNGRAASGQSGGGIRAQSTALVTIRDSMIVGNGSGSGSTGPGGSGGGIWTSAPMQITGSTISGNGSGSGGVSANGDFGFSAGSGGGIRSSGILTVTNSTISGNIAGIGGDGGLLQGNNGAGAGISSTGTLTVTHSTITGNSTSGAFGAGIQVASGSATLDHTIVALNSNSASTRSDVGGAVTARFSLISDNNGATITDNGGNLVGTATAPIDPRLGPLVNNGGRTLTHALLPLSPAIDAGDPAKVAGVGGTPLFDQRGNPNGRVLNSVGAIGTGIDIGAFEAVITPVTFVVSTLVDENDGNHSVGDLSLREAVALANADSTHICTITFAPALTIGGPATITLTMGQITITGDVTIAGPGAGLLTVAAFDPSPANEGNGSRIFNIDDSTSTLIEVEINGLRLTDGDVTGEGGAIFSRENLKLNSATIVNNTATHGGGISHRTGTLTITNSTISDNSTRIAVGNGNGGDGGGIWNAGTAAIINSTIAENFTGHAGDGVGTQKGGNGGNGAGLWNSGTVTVTSSVINGNSTGLGGNAGAAADSSFESAGDGGSGAGIWSSGTLSMFDSAVSANFTGWGGFGSGNFSNGGDGGSGGGIFSSGNLSVTNCQLIDNSTGDGEIAIGGVNPGLDHGGRGGDGGGIRSSGTLIVTSSLISGNSTGSGADGIEIRSFGGNGGSGGGISAASATVVDSVISNNHTGDGGLTVRTGAPQPETLGDGAGGSGGGIALGSGTIINSKISGNTTGDGGESGSDGGGIYCGGELTVTRCEISGNSTGGRLVGSTHPGDGSGGDGGGILMNDGLVADSTIAGNTANRYGGGIVISDGRITGCTISGNIVPFGISGRGGGGVLAFNAFDSPTEIRHTTITLNSAPPGKGGGILSWDGVSFSEHHTEVYSSIVSGNTGGDVEFYNYYTPPNTNTFVSLGYNIVGNGGGLPDFNEIGDQTGITNPLLGPLADNGGPTRTQAPLNFSPALDSGNPFAMPGLFLVPVYDQRGTPFERVVDWNNIGGPRIDIGAVERQPFPAASFGDYNQNGVVDAADYVVWRNTLSQNVSPYSGADGDGNGVVTQNDHTIWRSHFGQSIPPFGAGSESGAAAASANSGAHSKLELITIPSASVKAREEVIGPRASLFALFRPSSHSRQEPTSERSRMQRDSTIVAWQTSQPDIVKSSEDESTTAHDPSDEQGFADDSHLNTIDDYFALLAGEIE